MSKLNSWQEEIIVRMQGRHLPELPTDLGKSGLDGLTHQEAIDYLLAQTNRPEPPLNLGKALEDAHRKLLEEAANPNLPRTVRDLEASIARLEERIEVGYFERYGGRPVLTFLEMDRATGELSTRELTLEQARDRLSDLRMLLRHWPDETP